MDFTKTEKIDLSTIAVRGHGRSPLATRIIALEPGEAFIVSGVDRDLIEGHVNPLRRDGRGFSINKLELTRYRVTRLK